MVNLIVVGGRLDFIDVCHPDTFQVGILPNALEDADLMYVSMTV